MHAGQSFFQHAAAAVFVNRRGKRMQILVFLRNADTVAYVTRAPQPLANPIPARPRRTFRLIWTTVLLLILLAYSQPTAQALQQSV